MGRKCSRRRRKGRKPAHESPAAAICERLESWRRAPEAQKPSLRALAQELGTSHQLLSFHVRRLTKRQEKEYRVKAQEIRSKGLVMTYADEQQAFAYDRAALQALLHDVLELIFQKIEARTKVGDLCPYELEVVSVAVRRGNPQALKIKQALARCGLLLL